MEIWAFVYAKQKNVTEEQMAKGAGDCWTWTAIDADTKLIISYALGNRGISTAQFFMRDLASRISNRFQLTTDGHRVYVDAVEDAFGGYVDYSMLVKTYGMPSSLDESRYSPATCIGCRIATISGNPRPEAHQHIFCGTAKPEHENGNASLYSSHKLILKEA